MGDRVPNKVWHREKLLEYMSNPDNPVLDRKRLSIEVLGFSHASVIYTFFTPEELTKIEYEALELRRKRYAAKLMQVDIALFDRAITGDPQAIKLAYQRIEGWSEKQKQEITLDGPMLQLVLAFFPPEIADKLKTALIAKQKELT